MLRYVFILLQLLWYIKINISKLCIYRRCYIAYLWKTKFKYEVNKSAIINLLLKQSMNIYFKPDSFNNIKTYSVSSCRYKKRKNSKIFSRIFKNHDLIAINQCKWKKGTYLRI